MYGRREIFTDVERITSKNVIEVLRSAMLVHNVNRDRCEYLLNYEEGQQPLCRVKTYRSDIDIIDIDNVANEVTEFKLGYVWGNPITFVQSDDSDNLNLNKAITKLNKYYSLQGGKKKTLDLARYIEICGIGYTFTWLNTNRNVKSPFVTDVLDPRYTFVVKSSRYTDHRVLMGVSYRQDSLGNYYFTCITDDRRYEIENIVKIINGNEEKSTDLWQESRRNGEANPLGIVPIVEWVRASDRMGCFERHIKAIDALNIEISDIANGIDQNTQAIFHGNDIEFPSDENGNLQSPKTGDWILTKTTADGQKPFIEPITVEYDYTGILNFVLAKRSLILQKCNVPQRNDNSGGSTGVAMADASGWSAAEASANKQQAFQESAKLMELDIILRAIKLSPDIEETEEIKELELIDVVPNIKRQKTYELTVKTNAIVALLSKGFSLEDAISIAPLFEDPNLVIERSSEGVKKYQESQVFKDEQKQTEEKRPFADMSDQIDNSPNING